MKHRLGVALIGASLVFSGCNAVANGSETSLPSRAAMYPNAAATSQRTDALDFAKVESQIAVTFYGKRAPVPIYAMNTGKPGPAFCKIKPKHGSADPSGDSNGDIWLPEDFGGYYTLQSVIVEYSPSCGAPKLTLSDPGAAAVDVYVARSGEVYVANLEKAAYEPGNILVYEKGQTAPARTLGTSERDNYIGVTANTENHDVIASYAGCLSSCELGLMLFKDSADEGVPINDSSLFDPGVPTIDEHGKVLVPDRTTLRTYRPPYKTPGKTYTLEGNSSQCSLNKPQTILACSDYENYDVDVYAYPSVKFMYKFSRGFHGNQPDGVAQTPN